ncbi:MAG TPA: FkbM family methyltransferase [Thermoanaerobaculia bacterium]|nr:FkbM family methyltransferase [Thermoanaerobaculia bacterium]
MRPLLRAYALAHRTGFLNTSLGDAMFSRAYFAYKRFEDRHASLIRAHPEIFRGGNVIDVGANIGYTTVLFARAIDAAFKVFALEPEEENFARLERNLKRYRVADRVTARRAAAGATSGAIGLRVNPLHHGDHQVDPTGATVPLVALDEFSGPIRFVKIDVQGYEPAVLAGMHKLLHSDLTVSTEVDVPSLQSFGYTIADVETPLCEFSPHRIGAGGRLERISNLKDAVDRRGYADVIWRRP